MHVYTNIAVSNDISIIKLCINFMSCTIDFIVYRVSTKAGYCLRN